MKEYDDGEKFIQESWKLGRSCQKESLKLAIFTFGSFANAYDSFTKEMQARCRREMSGDPMTSYCREIAQMGVSMNSEVLRRYLEVLKTALVEMEQADVAPEPVDRGRVSQKGPG